MTAPAPKLGAPGTFGPLGLIGLGRTGLPIARNLRERGHAVVALRRSAADALEAVGGYVVDTPRGLAAEAQLIFSVLPSPAALEDVMGGDAGLLAGLGPGHVIVELSSYPLAVKERYRDLVAARGATLLDGEISGTPAMTAARKSVFLVSGERAVVDAVLPACRDAAEHALYAGAFGSATKLKLVANLLVAVHTAAAAEAMLLVERAGLDAVLAMQVLGLGAAASTMLNARAPSMVKRRFVDPAPGPVSMLAAYLEPIRALADDAAAPTPLFAVASQLFHRALADGRADEDIGCVIELLDQLAPAPPKKGRSP